MASREDNILTVCEYHIIEKTSLEELRKIHRQLGASAFEEVTITGTSFEGGGGTGVVSFPRLDYLAAIQRLIRRLDLDVGESAAPRISAVNDFSLRVVQT